MATDNIDAPGQALGQEAYYCNKGKQLEYVIWYITYLRT